jgi:hypothetical protein
MLITRSLRNRDLEGPRVAGRLTAMLGTLKTLA